jgi:hypothetical protein
MSDLPNHPPTALRGSLSSLAVLLIISSLSVAVVFAFGLVFHH